MDGEESSDEIISLPGRTVYPVAASNILNETVFYPGQREAHDSGYAELDVPLVAKSNRLSWVRQLDLQAVGRYDSFEEYTTSPANTIVANYINGTVLTSPNLLNGQPEPLTTNPAVRYHSPSGTIGFKYHPIDDLFLRWSYTSGYDSPAFSQLLAPISTGSNPIPTTLAIQPGVPTTSPWRYQQVTNDPVIGTAYYTPVETGGNPNLQPEKSRAIDWGIVFEPKFLPGLRIAVDYTKVTKFDDIYTPAIATLIQYSSQFPGRVVRSGPTGPIVFIDDTYVNAPETYTSSYNIEVDYTLKTASLGTWVFSGIGNSWQHYDIQSVVGGPFVEQLGNPAVSTTAVSGVTYGIGAGLAKFKGNLSLSWSKGPFYAGWMMRYVGPYVYGSYYGFGGPAQYYTGTAGGWISGQIAHDVYLGYRMGKVTPTDAWWKRTLANTTVRLGVNNIFDHMPPYEANSLGFPLLYSTYGDIRLASYILSVKKSF
jgi:outer membrane receptor protein involved in Fe transport